jgi:hypothetical protein
VLANPGSPTDIQFSTDGHYAYVADRNGDFRVVDVSSMANPVLVGNSPGERRPWRLNVRGNMVYMAAWGWGVYAFDVSTPAAPSLSKFYPTPGQANDIAFANDLISQQSVMCVPSGDGGLVVLKTKDMQVPTVYITDPTFSPSYTNTTASMNLGGGASDNVGGKRVTRANSPAGGGATTGTENWSVSGIVLQPGTNVLTVTAFDQAGNSGSDTLTVIYQSSKQEQTITFFAIANRTFGDAPVPLAAAASSGLPVYFNIVSGPAVLDTNLVTLLVGGMVTVSAWQPGNSNFNAAATVQRSSNVARLTGLRFRERRTPRSRPDWR